MNRCALLRSTRTLLPGPLIALAILIGAGTLQAQTPAADSPAPFREKSAYLNESIERELDKGRLKGGVIVFADSGGANFNHFGQGPDDTPLQGETFAVPLGGISRVFTAIALARVAEERGIALDEPITKALGPAGDAILKRKPANRKEPSLADIMAGSSGFARRDFGLFEINANPESATGNLAFLKERPPLMRFAPGTIGQHSAVDAGLAGAALEELTREPFHVLMRGHLGLFGPNKAPYDPPRTGPLATDFHARLPAANGLFAESNIVHDFISGIARDKETSALLRRVHWRPVPAAMGLTLGGLREGRFAGGSYYYLDTPTSGGPARLFLAPDGQNVFFALAIGSPTAGGAWLRGVTRGFLEKFYAARREAGESPGEAPIDFDPATLAGVYASAGIDTGNIEKFTNIFAALKIEPAPEGSLLIKPEIAGPVCGLREKTYFHVVRPGLLQSIPQKREAVSHIAFAAGEAGTRPRLFCDEGDRITFLRQPWTAYGGLHFRFAILILGGCLAVLVIGGRFTPSPDWEPPRRLTRFTAALIVLTLLALLPAFFWLERPTGLVPLSAGIGLAGQAVLAMGLFIAGLSSTLLMLTIRAARAAAWSGAGPAYTLTGLALCAACLAMLFYWRLLGFQY